MNGGLRTPRGRRRFALVGLGVLVLLWLPVWWFGNDLIRRMESSAPSVAHGTNDDGWLERGKRLPSEGPNFHTFSRVASLLGHTAVHSALRDLLLGSFEVLQQTHPGTTFIYGDGSFPSGGRLQAHKGHQNGSALDLFVPVLGADAHPAELPVGPWTEFGYWIDFDSTGHWQEFTIDFPALADELLTIDSVAATRGVRLTTVTLAPELVTNLSATPRGLVAATRIPWKRGPVTTRHDEQFHVEFALPGPETTRP